jgi:hypothetical protein
MGKGLCMGSFGTLSPIPSPSPLVADCPHDRLPAGVDRDSLHLLALVLAQDLKLFAALAATGMMSLAWMLLLTMVVFAEKALPQGQRTSAVVGGVLIGLGLAVASGAVSMPWAA